MTNPQPPSYSMLKNNNLYIGSHKDFTKQNKTKQKNPRELINSVKLQNTKLIHRNLLHFYSFTIVPRKTK